MVLLNFDLLNFYRFLRVPQKVDISYPWLALNDHWLDYKKRFFRLCMKGGGHDLSSRLERCTPHSYSSYDEDFDWCCFMAQGTGRDLTWAKTLHALMQSLEETHPEAEEEKEIPSMATDWEEAPSCEVPVEWSDSGGTTSLHVPVPPKTDPPSWKDEKKWTSKTEDFAESWKKIKMFHGKNGPKRSNLKRSLCHYHHRLHLLLGHLLLRTIGKTQKQIIGLID